MGNRQEFGVELPYNSAGEDTMTLEQSRTAEATESQAHYSPEEAGEILRIAAHLQDNTITAEQLRAIAREAGVSDENLERAIQQYEQSRQAEAHKQQQRANRKRRLVIWGSLSALTLFFLLLGSMSFTVRVEPSAISHNTTAHQPVNPIPSKPRSWSLQGNHCLQSRASNRGDHYHRECGWSLPCCGYTFSEGKLCFHIPDGGTCDALRLRNRRGLDCQYGRSSASTGRTSG
jgi:hypothetical protein